MPAPNISFAKIVATPTETAWSQAYNAGSLFLTLSLTSEDEEVSLPEEGKKLLNAIEAEFFGLEEKSLTTIQTVLTQTFVSLPPTITISLALIYIKDDLVYCFLQGEGAITLKREDKRAALLSGRKSPTLQTASGYLKTDDILLLQTEQFVTLIPEKMLIEAFEYPLPTDIAETITPLVHNNHEGGASAIVLAFKGIPRPFTPGNTLSESEDDTSSPEELSVSTTSPAVNPHHHPEKIDEPSHAVAMDQDKPSFFTLLRKKLFSFSPLGRLPRQKQLILGLSVLLLLVLLGSIVFTKQSQQQKEQQALFEEVYPQALKAYENGESLVSLNESFARDDFLKAQEILTELDGKFPPGSEEGKKIASLQEKLTKRLGSSGSGTSLKAEKAQPEDAPVLAAIQTTKGALAVTEDNEAIYLITNKTIDKIDKTTEKKEELIENDETWEQPVAISVYGSNLYVLDQRQGLLKFVPTDEGYEETSYFTSSEPNLSQTVSLTIDGSVYLLYKDGTIEKYTRAQKDPFTLSGIEPPLKNPSALTTTSGGKSLYILDKSNSRIVQVGKDGTYQKTYTSDVLKTAQAFSLSSSENEIFVLSEGTLYSLHLQ